MKIAPMSLGGLMACVCFICACAPKPETSFNEMKERACAGDVPGFFAYIDKTKIGENLAKTANQKAQTDAPKDGATAMGAALGAKLAEQMIPMMVQSAMTAWEDDVKKAGASKACKMEFVSAQAVDDKATVLWKAADGKQKTFEVTRFDKKWLVTAIGANTAPYAEMAKNAVKIMAQSAKTAFEQNDTLCKTAAAVPAAVPQGTRYTPSEKLGEDFGSGDPQTGWMSLRFMFEKPLECQYTYRAGGDYKGPKRGGPDPGPNGFEAAAECDPDGDGKASLFTWTGSVTDGKLSVANEAFAVE